MKIRWIPAASVSMIHRIEDPAKKLSRYCIRNGDGCSTNTDYCIYMKPGQISHWLVGVTSRTRKFSKGYFSRIWVPDVGIRR